MLAAVVALAALLLLAQVTLLLLVPSLRSRHERGTRRGGRTRALVVHRRPRDRRP